MCLRSRDTKRDVQVPLSHSIFDSLLMPRPPCVCDDCALPRWEAAPSSLPQMARRLGKAVATHAFGGCRNSLAYRGLPAPASLSMAGSDGYFHHKSYPRKCYAQSKQCLKRCAVLSILNAQTLAAAQIVIWSLFCAGDPKCSTPWVHPIAAQSGGSGRDSCSRPLHPDYSFANEL